MKKQKPLISFSFSDLKAIGFELKVEEYDKKLRNGDTVRSVKILDIFITKDNKNVQTTKEEIESLLYELGMNTSKNGRYWVDTKKLHRPVLSNSQTFDYRFVGEERLDREWLESGKASEEAISFTSNMADMANVIKRMTKGGD